MVLAFLVMDLGLFVGSMCWDSGLLSLDLPAGCMIREKRTMRNEV